MDRKFPAPKVDIIFNKIKGSAASASMTFEDFMLALSEICLQKNGSNCDVPAEMQAMFAEKLEPLLQAKLEQLRKLNLPLVSTAPNPIAEECVNDPAVKTLIAEYAKPLRKLFLQYSRLGPEEKIQGDSTDTSSLVCTESSFRRFAQQFGFVPDFLNQKQLTAIFRDANVAFSRELNELELRFDEFVECLVRIAAVAFSGPAYAKEYPTPLSKVELMLFVLDERGAIGFKGFSRKSLPVEEKPVTVRDLLD